MGHSLFLCRNAFLQLPASSSATAPPANIFFPMVLPGSSISATAPRSATSSRWLSATVPPSSSPWHFRPSALPRRPGLPSALPLRCPSQQHLPDSSSLQRPCRQSSVPTVPCLQQLRRSAPASNKPHLAEKSTPVWLAIWRTWAGFANSQHRDAAFATPENSEFFKLLYLKVVNI